MKYIPLLEVLMLTLLFFGCAKESSLPSNPDHFRGTISGTVTSPETGKGIAGVSVTTDPSGFSTATDSLGHYSIPDVAAGTYTLIYSHSDYYDTTVNAVEILEGQAVTNIDVTIRMKAAAFRGSISGTITNEKGTRLSGVFAALDSSHVDNSDSSGKFTIVDVVPGTYDLFLSHPHYFDTTVSGVEVTAETVTKSGLLVIRRNPVYFPGSITGRVTDALTGKGLAGASVTADTAGYTTTTDTSGRYTVPGVVAGTYGVTVAHPDYFDTTLYPVEVGVGQNIVLDTVALTARPDESTGSVKGYVVDSTGAAISGAMVLASPSGKSAQTNSAGMYIISGILVRDLQFLFAYGTYRSDSLKDIQVSENDTIVLDTLEAKRTDVDVRTINGDLTGNIADVDRMTATLTGDGIDSAAPIVIPLDLDRNTKKYSAFIFTPKGGENWHLAVRVVDLRGRLIGFHEMDFNRLTGDIDMPDFGAQNAVPTADAGLPATVSINDPISLQGNGNDSFGGSILKYEWDVGNTGIFTWTSSGDTSFNAPPLAGNLICVLRVTDNDGNTMVDAVTVTVVADAPVPSALAAVSAVSIGDRIVLEGTAMDTYGTIVRWEWDPGATGTFTDVTPDSALVVTAPPSPDAAYPCILRVTDDDGNKAMDTVHVAVELDAPLPSASASTPLVSINDSISLLGSAVDGYGSIVRWEWDLGATGAFVDVTPDSNISGTALDAAGSRFLCILRVTDDDGLTVLDTAIIDVRADPPAAEIAMADTSIRVDSAYTLSASASSPGQFGRIIKYEWSIGAYNAFVEGSGDDTTLIAPSLEQKGFPVVLRITDDDLNTALDTVLLRIYKDWDILGSPAFTPGNASYTDIAIFGGVPYIAYQDQFVSSKISVMKYAGGTWMNVGQAGFSADMAMDVEIEMHADTPYVVFSDMDAFRGATVMKYTGSGWSYVGTPGFSTGGVAHPSLAFYNDTPYVSFVSWGNGYKAEVMKYNGIGWEMVGAAGISEGQTQFSSLAFSNGVPYVAFSDKSRGEQSSVMKFEGGAWSYVGGQGFSEGKNTNQSLVIHNGTPYLAFEDWNVAGAATVMKFDGGSWVTVGDPGFSGGEISEITLAFSGDTAYAAYADLHANRQTTVKRFVGGVWELAGSRGFNAGRTGYVSMAIENGKPRVVSSNDLDGYKATVHVLQ